MRIVSNRFAEVLKKLRKEGNLTQEDLSKVISADRSSVANYERGERLPPIDSLIMIAEHFKVSLDYLILGKDQSSKSEEEFADEMSRELMAENTSLMEDHLKLNEKIADQEKEIKLLKEHLESMEKYVQYLKNKSSNFNI